MENNNKIERTKTIYIKQMLAWHTVYDCLATIDRLAELKEDKKFWQIYGEMVRYVDEKLDTHFDGPIKDMYTVVEQEASEEEYQRWLKKGKSAF